MSGKDSVKSKPRKKGKEKHVSTSGVLESPRASPTPERANNVVYANSTLHQPSKANKILPNVTAGRSTFVGASVYMRVNGVFSAANAAVSIFASAAYSRPLDSAAKDQIEFGGSASYNSVVIPIERSTGSLRSVQHKSDISVSSKSSDRLHAIIVCGPSGSGKSTLLKKLISEFPDCFAFCVSHTTRKPRPGEVNGKDYHFVTKSVFDRMVKNNDFFENTEFSGNNYGTSKEALRNVVNSGRICIKDVDLNGVASFIHSDVNPMLICIKAPSIEVLRKRLLDRKTETEETLRRRIEKAREEEQAVSEYMSYFEKVIINDDLDTAYGELRDFLLPEIDKLKATRGSNKMKTLT